MSQSKDTGKKSCAIKRREFCKAVSYTFIGGLPLSCWMRSLHADPGFTSSKESLFKEEEKMAKKIVAVTAKVISKKGTCGFHDGPADNPSVVIKTPADVWLAVSKGELDGQQAFMSGRYKVEGDLSLLLKLKSLFSG